MKRLFASWEKISCDFYPTFHLYNRIYKGVVQREVLLGNINSRDTVLNIGCGAIPFTAINATRVTGAGVVALDNDMEAVEKARYCLKKYRLDDRIEVLFGDGEDEIDTSFSVAIVALQVENKVKVFENLKKRIEKGGRIIFRQPIKNYKEHYGYLPDEYMPHSRIRQNMKAFKESYLFSI